METEGFISAFEPVSSDSSRAQDSPEPEFKEIITGGPKKYLRKRLVRNPKYRLALPKKPLVRAELVQLGERLRAIRLESGLTQAQLAHELKTTQSTISLMEYGHLNPSLSYLDRYLAILGKRIEIRIYDI